MRLDGLDGGEELAIFRGWDLFGTEIPECSLGARGKILFSSIDAIVEWTKADLNPEGKWELSWC